VLELNRRNIEATHIDISKYKYKHKSAFDRIHTSVHKLFFGKYKKKRLAVEQIVVGKIKELGHQDIVLIIRPDKVSTKTHLQIKGLTDKYLAYIYDSCKRFPINHLMDVFDEIYSFDIKDSKTFGFTFIPNFIYMDKRALSEKVNDNIFIVITIDERFNFLNKLANYLSEHGIGFKFIAVGKKYPKKIHPKIVYAPKVLLPEELKEDLENSKIFLDLIRKDHNGLSFRIFEALAMQRKIITTNASISGYDFYNPNNILILDEKKEIKIDPDFLNSPYAPLPDEVYYKYTIENWVNTVFKLESK
jgi:hypothetical protein